MSWTDDPDHPFAGIAEKLKRADQNIVNLHAEITAFLKGGKYPIIPRPNDQSWQEAVNYHRSKRIPLRFSVLAGEVIHHLRSSLDHIVWHFTSNEVKLKSPGAIEFPIFEVEPDPSDKDAVKRYERKIQGITNAQVRTWIEIMQPYNVGPEAANDPMLIIHDMDRFDKHRELAIVDSSALINFPATMPDVAMKAALYTQGKLPASERPVLYRALNDYAEVTPNVAFRQFGKRQTYPVIPALAELLNEVSTLVGVFATEA